ncbi:hypothetical protein BHU72_07400 [Desulfuribacillus stibiiarsenatis]|uniref:HTH lysR-type domain-containing protein n=1 Tax=Desulfuribacillus stibiiarsenatis TaxID=1390249 RepID=A0A1E5L4G3_9FIRM|nr:LysR family transcriptional regulator [Desulfuribacillus stibiiarsenatis]OEH85005.1 hypothetical protein BHU72_07400 [Desulfuribacillus stibiiarsenatis]
MEFHQLKTFYYVATYLNFSKAAEKVSLSQPAVSRQIESLEKEFNVSLFNRSGKRVKLTDAGNRLLQYSQKILMVAEETEKAMLNHSSIEAGEISLGAGTTVGNYIVAPLICEFMNRYQDIHIDLKIDNTTAIIEQMKKGSIDMAIIAKSLNHPEFYYQPIIQDEIILVCSKEHPLTNIENPAIDQIEKEIFFLRARGSNTRECTDKICAENQLNPIRINEFQTNEAIKQSVSSGFGIGFLPVCVMKTELECGRLVPIGNMKYNREFALVYPKSKYPSSVALIFNSFLKKNIYKYSYVIESSL